MRIVPSIKRGVSFRSVEDRGEVKSPAPVLYSEGANALSFLTLWGRTMLNRTKKFLPLIILAAFFLAAGCSDSTNKAKPKSSKPVPNWTLPTVDGGTLSYNDLKGKVILIDFWATWCPPCRAAIPHLNKIYNENKENGVIFVGMSLDNNPDDVKNFLSRTPVDYPIVFSDRKTMMDFGVSPIPRVFVIDRNGVIQGDFTGYDPYIGDAIEKVVIRLAAEY
ncbi:MAG: hypothetical protein C0608_05665 [Deltaproteobacteria bacterium]|nr:MAG: hypothetical protein C0608_05665 [Deltaproteobacteria bacterium]